MLKLLAHSLNDREIGERLLITENTVKNHMRNILQKLQVHSRTEAAVHAVRAVRAEYVNWAAPRPSRISPRGNAGRRAGPRSGG